MIPQFERKFFCHGLLISSFQTMRSNSSVEMIDESDASPQRKKGLLTPLGSNVSPMRAAGLIGVFLFAVPLVLLRLLSLQQKRSEFGASNDEVAVMPAPNCFVRPTYRIDAIQTFKDISKDTELLLDLYSPGYDPRPTRPTVFAYSFEIAHSNPDRAKHIA
eukprot:Skav224546  [mRNA]  locus=scaffold2085:37061:41276:+ [translate_table: standard]